MNTARTFAGRAVCDFQPGIDEQYAVFGDSRAWVAIEYGDPTQWTISIGVGYSFQEFASPGDSFPTTGDGSLGGLRYVAGVIRQIVASAPDGVTIMAIPADRKRERAYRWLLRLGFTWEPWSEPDEEPDSAAGYYIKTP